MILRRAEREDCRLWWEWANDPAARAWSFSSQPIPWEHHAAWFEQKLRDPKTFLYLVLDDHERPLAQVRFELHDAGEAETSVNVDPARRSAGHGTQALRQAAQRLFAESDAKRAVAYIKPENTASLHAFEKAGFSRAGTEMRKGFPAVKMVLVPEVVSIQ